MNEYEYKIKSALITYISTLNISKLITQTNRLEKVPNFISFLYFYDMKYCQ